MKDKAIVEIATETCRVLSDAPWHLETKYLLPSYNALMEAARANHPQDPFLRTLASVEASGEEVNAPQMNILFTQLRIAVESLQEDDGTKPASQGAAPSPTAAF
jgi:hypothetical protein